MRQIENTPENKRVVVSIHAPREGCDGDRHLPRASFVVSIHAPREGCDRRRLTSGLVSLSFNSRTPGGVRLALTHSVCLPISFNSRTPGGVRLPYVNYYYGVKRFNSRTPGGVRLASILSACWLTSFNSRTPGGVRPWRSRAVDALYNVSIHAPREGCDLKTSKERAARMCFNSRTPGGVRL